MSRTSIQKAIDQFPELTDFGIGIYKSPTNLRTPEERDVEFKKNRAALLDSVDSFEKTCIWLSTKKKIKTINSKHSSYGLKHMAEHEIGYITNGVFIAAAIHFGFDVKVIDGGPNVMINISKKSLKNCEYMWLGINKEMQDLHYRIACLNRGNVSLHWAIVSVRCRW